MAFLRSSSLWNQVSGWSPYTCRLYDRHARLLPGSNAPLNDILVLPADLVAQTADGAVLAAGLQTQHTQSLGDDHLLLVVVGRGDTLEDLEALESSGTAGGLVGNHAADSLVEDARGGTEVERTWDQQSDRVVIAHREKCRLTSAGGVVSGHLAQVGVVLDCLQTVSNRSWLFDISGAAQVDLFVRPVRRNFARRGVRSWTGARRTLRAEELSGDVESLAADDDNLLAAQQLLGNNTGQAAEKVALAIDDDLEQKNWLAPCLFSRCVCVYVSLIC